MYTILISLLSDQTIPNVLFIKELMYRNENIDEYVFVSTYKMEEKNKSQNITTSCELKEYRTITVTEDNLDKIKINLSKENFTDDAVYLLNISGGTKIMALGVYSYFIDNHKKSTKIYCLPIGKNKILKIYPENYEENIQYRLGLEEYVLAHGINEYTTGCLSDFSINPCDFATIYERNRDLIFNLVKLQNINRVKKIFNNKKPLNLEEILTDEFKEKNNINIDNKNLNDLLNKCSFDSKSLKRKNLRFITGGWFEEHVYNIIKSHLKLKDDKIKLNVKLKKEAVENEFDVMFVFNNSLHIVECKTGLKGKEGNLLNDTLYKQQALRLNFGLTVKSYLFTRDKLSIESERAKMFNITIFDGNDFENKGTIPDKLDEIFKVK